MQFYVLSNCETFSYGFLVRRSAYTYTYFFKVCFCVKVGIFYLKRVKFLFLFRIFQRRDKDRFCLQLKYLNGSYLYNRGTRQKLCITH